MRGSILPPLSGAPTDLAPDLDALKPFGQPCAVNAECQSDLCFVGGMMTFCSLPCTAATQAKDCPVPPTSGLCNMKGFCKP